MVTVSLCLEVEDGDSLLVWGERCGKITDSMDEILEALNLSSLKKNFQDNKVDPTDVLSLTEEDFRSLVVQTIGERARLRQRCKNLVSESMSESPVVQRLRMFQSQRRQRVSWRGPNSAASRSTTRRLHIGWKHKSRSTYIPVMDIDESTSDDGDELPSMDSGTPTIVFNERHGPVMPYKAKLIRLLE
ncbi:uncharacterized protein LOC124275926 isoform X2 [Haliotis rubra]|uniref:uncharacterized protein LOC124275926 isoform X2 n=1 Tax=Haliotis rubra TaxID=36100 RepID=UPI001EE5EEED|nr:uncharacterized protein LOC124275926 isoform X2 [Haliotis rubra]